ncbi:MAG: FAD-dependent oxidoreductase [Candidatus Methylomirabilia bacterium]
MTEGRLPAHPAQRIDCSRSVTLDLAGRPIPAYAGDTVASALYAAGVRIFSRSFKYHRPRGLLCCAGRCPNCLMNVDGVPNVRTCTEPVYDGMRIRPQHAWPSLQRDVFSFFDALDRLLPVGFYYKTFIHPAWLRPTYERILRSLSGLGEIAIDGEPSGEYDTRHLFPDVAVVGGGPAGMTAALEAARAGLSVLLVDDQPALGGHLQVSLRPVEGVPEFGGRTGNEAGQALSRQVLDNDLIRVRLGAAAFGLYEGSLLGVLEGRRFLRVRARRVIVATGGFEHPLVFHGNDLPGVMLGSAAQRLMALYAVKPGASALVVASDGSGVGLTQDLLSAGARVVALADCRPEPRESAALAEVRRAGVPVFPSTTIAEARGDGRVRSARLIHLDRDGRSVPGGEVSLSAEVICLAGGFEPAASLLGQGGARLHFDSSLGQFIPVDLPPGVLIAGEVSGRRELATVLLQGRWAGSQAAADLTGEAKWTEQATDLLAESARPPGTEPRRPLVSVPGPGRKKFVCLCEDVTEKDLEQAVREGFDHIETLKRYTTTAMGPCQGKMCHMASVDITARATGRSIEETGVTTARPPVQPVPLGALAGRYPDPVKLTPMHHQHVALGAQQMDMGVWKRPFMYAGVEAECRAVHERVAIIDVSTLGKLDVKGRDAGAFLDWLHPNRFSDLKVGRIRYRVMCDDAGIILDDGTVARLREGHFFVTTGTGSLDAIQQWCDWWLAGTGRCVHVVNVTGGLAAINLAGPRSREVLAKLTALDLSREAFPYLAAKEALVAGVPTLILRIGFVGELGYEMHFAADYGEHMWGTLMEAGRDFGISPFGVEAQRVLRLEKQHIIPAHDTDALSNPLEADMAWVVKFDKDDFIGRDALTQVRDRGMRQRLVGFEVVEPGVVPGEGDAVVLDGQPIGRVTSSKWSPHLAKAIGMAWLPAEQAVEGAEFRIRTNGRLRAAKVVTKPFFDPEGARLRA